MRRLFFWRGPKASPIPAASAGPKGPASYRKGVQQIQALTQKPCQNHFVVAAVVVGGGGVWGQAGLEKG